MPAPMLPGQSGGKKLDPQLPPQLQSLENKSVDDVIKELNQCPFFMTSYDDQDGQNESLEALKALAYEGEPEEIASNFKNQGNDCFKSKQYKNAVEYYNKAIDVKCGDKDLESKVYCNRAQCNLFLKNYRRCINDCQKALAIDPTLVKAYFRMGKAFIQINKFKEAKEAIQFGLQFLPDDSSMKDLLKEAETKTAQLNHRLQKEHDEKIAFAKAITMRQLSLVFTKLYSEDRQKFRLEDKKDFESQIIFSGFLHFPSIGFDCFLVEIGELSTVADALLVAYHNSPDKFEGHPELDMKKAQIFMETISGGLVKVGKNKTFHEILTSGSPVVPVIDWILKLYIVPKEQIDTFIAKWDKKEKLASRVSDDEVTAIALTAI